VIDTHEGTDDWSKLARGRVPPPTAYALDQEAYDTLRTTYPSHQIFGGPGVVQRAPGPEEKRQATMQGELERLTREVEEAQARLAAINDQIKERREELRQMEQATARAERARDAAVAQLRQLAKLFGFGAEVTDVV
jgi:septal ring factor EnvC (AmiA/AmiB activator)